MTVGVYEAKTHFSEYAERAAQGEEIIITRHGVPFFRFAPVETKRDPEKIRATIERLKKFREAHPVEPGFIKRAREEGRR